MSIWSYKFTTYSTKCVLSFCSLFLLVVILSFDKTTPELNNCFEPVTVENLHVVFETILL